MKIGIIGAGRIGSILARHFGSLQHTVLIANSRGPETLSRVAKETGAAPVDLSKVADGVDLLVIAIPMKGIRRLPKDLLDRLPATSPIVDTGNYYPPRDGAIREIDNGMVEAEWTSHILGRPVIKAFNNITADSMAHRGLPKGSKNRVALPVSGNDVAQKQEVMALVEAIGFDAFDAGPLQDSWRYQPGTPAYCPDPTIQQLPTLLQRADRNTAPKNRDSAVQMLGDLVFEYPRPQDLVRITRLSSGLDTWKLGSWLAALRVGLAVLRYKLG
jgi:8-hydroxy-5-deazaflavin:NADPH oxidoreductase